MHKRLRRSGDVFAAAAALADKKRVEAALREHPDFARERDAGGLTALSSAPPDRAWPGPLVETSRLLIDAGADIRAKTR